MRTVRVWLGVAVWMSLGWGRAAQAQLNGDWHYEGETKSLEHVRISGLMVHAWAARRPGASDWGTINPHADGGDLVAVREADGVRRTFRFKLAANDPSRLVVTDYAVYTDDSRRRPSSYEYVFLRTPPRP